MSGAVLAVYAHMGSFTTMNKDSWRSVKLPTVSIVQTAVKALDPAFLVEGGLVSIYSGLLIFSS